MDLEQLLEKNRSYRRFDSNFSIKRETLEDLVNLTRLGSSAANRQPLKFYISNTKEKNDEIFSQLKWASYLSEWEGPADNERPSAYIIITLDKDIAKDPWCDHGIAAQNILLGAVSRDLGGCILGAFSKQSIKKAVEAQDNHEPLLVIAIGKPAETSIVEEIPEDIRHVNDSIRYYRDEKGIHRVPKRPLEEIIVN
ncbi:MAG: nitroreductase family protein [Spirochaetales bacterium]|nr:nitroreductase family protein [Spirochaetales bacterium]